MKCHIFASIRPTDRYNHLKWGAKCHLIPLETSFFYLPDRPTAEKPFVKNLPFKEQNCQESTDDGLSGQNLVLQRPTPCTPITNMN